MSSERRWKRLWGTRRRRDDEVRGVEKKLNLDFLGFVVALALSARPPHSAVTPAVSVDVSVYDR